MENSFLQLACGGNYKTLCLNLHLGCSGINTEVMKSFIKPVCNPKENTDFIEGRANSFKCL